MFNKRILSLILLLFMAINSNASSKADIHFEVSFVEPQAHYAEVKMQINNIKKDEIVLKMPVWAPGSYLVREFSKNLESFNTADNNGNTLPFEKIRKNGWRVKTKGKNSIIVTYRIYAYEISVRTSFIDANHAFLSSSGVFLFVDGALDQPVSVTINPHRNWNKVSTGLDPIEGDKPHTFMAKNFDWLFDSPIEVGNQDVIKFTAAGVDHELAMVGGGNYDSNILKTDISKIIEEETRMFGENPNKRYVFIVHHYQKGGGGLEHLNSTVLGASRDGYTDSKTYKGFLSLVAHEYIHLWNVKRLRPIALGPFDYDNENYTTNLWIAEGFTAYYDNLITTRTGVYNPNEFLGILESDINAVFNQPGSKVQSVSQSSFDAWIKYYRPDENSSNTTISYYTKGSLIAALLDLAIINQSNGTQSLDDAMKYAYEEFYKKKGRGYTDAEMKSVFEKFTGQNLDQFYKDYIYGTAELDFNTYLGYAGLRLKDATVANQPYLGIALNDANKITNVTRLSAAYADGLNVNDEILAIDFQRYTDLSSILEKYKVGDQLTFTVNRDGILKNIQVKLTPSRNKNWQISQVEKPTSKQRAVLKKWLSL